MYLRKANMNLHRRQVDDLRDASIRQNRRASNARKLEDLGRVDRATRNDNLPSSIHSVPRSTRDESNASRCDVAAALDCRPVDLLDKRAGEHGKIPPRGVRVEVRGGGVRTG